MDLTKRQKEIFDYIRKYASKHGYPPTVREIGKAVGLHSSSTVHAHLSNLEKSGLLRRDPTKPRAIELLVDKAKRVVQPGVPLLGDEATVKRFYREKDRIRLQPANKAHKPIRTRDAKVLGRVVGVFRS